VQKTICNRKTKAGESAKALYLVRKPCQQPEEEKEVTIGNNGRYKRKYENPARESTLQPEGNS